jgi:hypothetical protein
VSLHDVRRVPYRNAIQLILIILVHEANLVIGEPHTSASAHNSARNATHQRTGFLSELLLEPRDVGANLLLFVGYSIPFGHSFLIFRMAAQFASALLL